MSVKMKTPTVEMNNALNELDATLAILKAEVRHVGGGDPQAALDKMAAVKRWVTQVSNHVTHMVQVRP